MIDNKTVVDKANKIIEKVQEYEGREQPKKIFKKTWKLQNDGDLWEKKSMNMLGGGGGDR